MDFWWKATVLMLVIDAVGSLIAAILITKRIDILMEKMKYLEKYLP